jgi:hypothetical protein
MQGYLRQWVDSPVWEECPYETDGGRQWVKLLTASRAPAAAHCSDIAHCGADVPLDGLAFDVHAAGRTDAED